MGDSTARSAIKTIPILEFLYSSLLCASDRLRFFSTEGVALGTLSPLRTRASAGNNAGPDTLKGGVRFQAGGGSSLGRVVMNSVQPTATAVELSGERKHDIEQRAHANV